LLHDRAGFGLAAADLPAAVARGVDAELGRLLQPDAAGVPAPADAWDDTALGGPGGGLVRQGVLSLVGSWLDRMVSTPRPLIDRLAWFWHGHFTTDVQKVRFPLLVANQLRLFQQTGLGPFPALVRAVTIDPAMLLYLDGDASTGDEPNENYGRELLELFTLGRGAYSEADVQAGARALTGWRVRPGNASAAVFVPARHDDAPQAYLGRTGVHDVDTVVAAVVAQPALAGFIAGKVARALLGPAVTSATVDDLARVFAASGLDVGALVKATLDRLVQGHDVSPIVLAPVPWLVRVQRLTGAVLTPAARLGGLQAAGQVPCMPPNVAGWPSGDAWISSAAVVARFDLAAALARALPADSPVLAATSDPDALAQALGRPAGFSPQTKASLQAVRAPASRLVLALTSPELVLV
jgi:uncharacterized protein (DUF1800 family)